MQNTLKNKLKANKLTLGSWITIGSSCVAEIMAKAGFDWLAIDMEHSAITLSEALRLIQVIELAGISPLVRVSENNANIIKRAMDTGAHGVIVPMVNSKHDAIKAVKAVKYPPVGTRGVGLARAQGYGVGFDEYKANVNEKSVVIVQIEHIDAVNNIEEILNTEGLDGFIVGPYDLSASMGEPGNFNSPQMQSALEKVMLASKKSGIPAGFHVIFPEHSQVEEKIKQGYRFIGYSLDEVFLAYNVKKDLSMIEKIRSKN